MGFQVLWGGFPWFIHFVHLIFVNKKIVNHTNKYYNIDYKGGMIE
jgi:hypothetical protein